MAEVKKPSQKFKRKHILDLWTIPIYFEKFTIISLLISLNSLLYGLFILPLRFMSGALKRFLWCRRLNRRARFDMYYYGMILVVTFVFLTTSDTSSIYHWIKGKSFVKLYSFYVILEVCDLLNRSVGKDLVYSLARNIYYKEMSFRVAALLGVYTLMHSYLLLFQLLTMNSVIKSSRDTFLLFLLSNNFCEVKITVFKKTDIKMLFELANRDTIERLQQMIYFGYIFMNNTIDQTVINSVIFMFFSEFLVDWMKHFFLNKLYYINPCVYLYYRYTLWKLLIDWREKRENREGPEEEKLEDDPAEDIVKDLETEVPCSDGTNAATERDIEFIKECNQVKDHLVKECEMDLLLYRNTVNEYFYVSLFQSFMLLPQVWLVLRCICDFILNKELAFSEAILFLIIVIAVGTTFEFICSRILRWSANRIVKKKYYS